MDHLEQELRRTFNDDRLSVAVRPDALNLLQAGVRRRRRNRTLASAAAAVVLIAGGATAATLARHAGGGPQRVVGPALSTPPPAVKPSMPAPSHDEIPWADDAYDFRQPPAFPGAVADLSVPWCKADQLALSAFFQGATGDWVGRAEVTNTSSSSCAVQGQPAVSMLAGDGRVLVHSTPEPFYVDQWVRLAPGKAAGASIDWAQEFCHEPAPARVTVDLPHNGGSLSTSMSGSPRCNAQSDPPSAGRLNVDGFTDGTDRPFTPEAGLGARVERADTSVAPGATLNYRLQLQSMAAPQVALDPCLPYRERLVDHATQHVLIEEDHLLNCGDAGAISDPPSNHDTFFDLELVVPANAPQGDYDLLWQSVLKPVSAVGEQLVHVSAPVPACKDGEISADSNRDGGGAGGSYYERILFHNISTTTCSLYGYPGVKLTDANGHAVKTDTQRGPATSHLIVLKPGAVASATISGADSGPNGGATPCKPTAGVLVIAPGQHVQTLVRGVGMRCYDTVIVWPVVAGTRGSLGG